MSIGVVSLVVQSIVKLGNIIQINGERNYTQSSREIGNLHYNNYYEEDVFIEEISFETPCELDIFYEINSECQAHIRGELIEIFDEEKKVMELKVESNHFVLADFKESTLRIRFSGKHIESLIQTRSKNFLNKREQLPFQVESVYKSHRDIRYHFVEAKDPKHAKELVIVFSAMSPEFTYNFNYIKTMESFPMNQLYILDDYGSQGSYYLGHHRDHAIETSVVSLILHYISKLNTTLSNVLSFGSSKGGYSALYYALKYSFGEVLTLAPSLFLGDFLKGRYPNITQYITGEDDEGSYHYLNELIYSLVKENRESLPKIHIMVGTKDSRKEMHIEPFTKHLEKADIIYTLDIIKGVNHSELKFFAPEYLKRFISLKYDLGKIPEIYLTGNTLMEDNDTLVANASAIGDELTYAFYWYLNDEIIKKEAYSINNESIYQPVINGRYRVRIFIKNKKGEMITRSTKSLNYTKPQISIDSFNEIGLEE